MGKEYKNRVPGPMLGTPIRERSLHSPNPGVPIKKDNKESRTIIRNMEKLLGLRSWIDNV